MPRQQRFPEARLHKPSGLGRIRLDGRDVYLGRFGSEEAKRKHAALRLDWMMKQSGRQGHQVMHLMEVYRREHGLFPGAKVDRHLAFLRKVSEHVLAWDELALRALSAIGPADVEGFIERLADMTVPVRDAQGEVVGSKPRYTRGSCNKAGQAFMRMIRWGERKGYAPIGTMSRLAAVQMLQYGRSPARESKPVPPVAIEVVTRTIEHTTSVVRDMVLLQLASAMRPGEVCSMTFGQIERSGAVWWYAPEQRKNKHRGQGRRVPLGPRCQTILMRYLDRADDAAVSYDFGLGFVEDGFCGFEWVRGVDCLCCRLPAVGSKRSDIFKPSAETISFTAHPAWQLRRTRLSSSVLTESDGI